MRKACVIEITSRYLIYFNFSTVCSVSGDCGSKSNCTCFTKPKPTLSDIIKQCEKSGEPWVDTDFPPTLNSLVINPNSTVKKNWLSYKWLRPEKVHGVTEPKIFIPPLD